LSALVVDSVSVARRFVAREEVVTPALSADAFVFPGGAEGDVLTQTASGLAAWLPNDGGGGNACEPGYDAVIVATPDPDCPEEYATVAEAAAVGAQNILVKEATTIAADPTFAVATTLFVMEGVDLTVSADLTCTDRLTLDGPGTLALGAAVDVTAPEIHVKVCNWNLGAFQVDFIGTNVTVTAAQVESNNGTLQFSLTAAEQQVTVSDLQTVPSSTMTINATCANLTLTNCALPGTGILLSSGAGGRIANSTFGTGDFTVANASRPVDLSGLHFAGAVTFVSGIAASQFRAVGCTFDLTLTLTMDGGLYPADFQLHDCVVTGNCTGSMTSSNANQRLSIQGCDFGGSMTLTNIASYLRFCNNRLTSGGVLGGTLGSTNLVCTGNTSPSSLRLGDFGGTEFNLMWCNNLIAVAQNFFGDGVVGGTICNNASESLNMSDLTSCVFVGNKFTGGTGVAINQMTDCTYASNIAIGGTGHNFSAHPLNCQITGNRGNLVTVAGAQSNILVGNKGTITNFTGTEVPAGVNIP